MNALHYRSYRWFSGITIEVQNFAGTKRYQFINNNLMIYWFAWELNYKTVTKSSVASHNQMMHSSLLRNYWTSNFHYHLNSYWHIKVIIVDTKDGCKHLHKDIRKLTFWSFTPHSQRILVCVINNKKKRIAMTIMLK